MLATLDALTVAVVMDVQGAEIAVIHLALMDVLDALDAQAVVQVDVLAVVQEHVAQDVLDVQELVQAVA